MYQNSLTQTSYNLSLQMFVIAELLIVWMMSVFTSKQPFIQVQGLYILPDSQYTCSNPYSFASSFFLQFHFTQKSNQSWCKKGNYSILAHQRGTCCILSSTKEVGENFSVGSSFLTVASKISASFCLLSAHSFFKFFNSGCWVYSFVWARLSDFFLDMLTADSLSPKDMSTHSMSSL